MAQTEAGIATEDLARRIDVRLRTVQRWRDGASEPQGAALGRLCAALDRPVEFFYPAPAPAEAA